MEDGQPDRLDPPLKASPITHEMTFLLLACFHVEFDSFNLDGIGVRIATVSAVDFNYMYTKEIMILHLSFGSSLATIDEILVVCWNLWRRTISHQQQVLVQIMIRFQEFLTIFLTAVGYGLLWDFASMRVCWNCVMDMQGILMLHIDNFIHRKETIEHNTNQIKLNNN